MRSNSRKHLFCATAFGFLIISLFWAFGSTTTEGFLCRNEMNTPHYTSLSQQEDDLGQVNFSYRIYCSVQKVDYARRYANVLVSVTIEGCEKCNFSEIWISMAIGQYRYGISNSFVKCPRFDSVYFAQETLNDLPLMGDRESYPFDSLYRLRFRISRQFYFIENNTLKIGIPNATFDQSGSSFDIKIVQPDEYNSSEFFIDVERDPSMPLFQLLLPIVLCYFVLGGSMLVKRSELGTRLRIYMTLYVFAPTFLLAIQSYLPYRSFLCIPEILLVGILSVTSMFFFSSILKQDQESRLLDGVTVAVSVVFLAYLYYRIMLIQMNYLTLLSILIPEIGLSISVIVRSRLRNLSGLLHMKKIGHK